MIAFSGLLEVSRQCAMMRVWEYMHLASLAAFVGASGGECHGSIYKSRFTLNCNTFQALIQTYTLPHSSYVFPICLEPS